MLGKNHAACGMLAGLATMDRVPVHDLEHELAWVMLFSGCALLSDLDSAGSSGSRMWGDVSGAMSPLITRLTGGHRWGTHDVVLAPLVVGVLTWVGLHTGQGRYLVVGLLIGLAFRAATLGDNRARTILSNLAVSIGGAWWIVGHHLETGMHLPWIVAAGIWVHCAGDLITPEGLPIPILWLHSRRWRFAIPLFRVGHWFETWIITPSTHPCRPVAEQSPTRMVPCPARSNPHRPAE